MNTNRTDRNGKQICVNDNILYKGKQYQIVWWDERLTFGLLSPDGIIQTFLANCNCDDIIVAYAYN